MSPSSLISMIGRLGLVYSAFLLLDVLFWSMADFRKFLPPSEGPWLERADWALLTALGPISMTQIDSLRTGGLVACAAILGAVAAAVHWRDLVWVRGLAYAGIVVWWLVGLGSGVSRIT